MAAAIPLDLIEVKTPCTAPWSAMHGTDTVRFCDHCSKNVYNLSAMPRSEAEALIVQKEGHLCVRFYRRSDGTMLTSDCGNAFGRAARSVARRAGALAAVLIPAALMTAGASTGADIAPYAIQNRVVVPMRQMSRSIVRTVYAVVSGQIFARSTATAGIMTGPVVTMGGARPLSISSPNQVVQGDMYCPPTTQPTTTQPATNDPSTSPD